MRTSFAGLCAVAALILGVGLPAPVFALSTVTIASSGEGVFQVQGIGIEDAAALDITVRYDAETLAAPRVVEGPLVAGAMTAINAAMPGVVRMVVVRLTPVKGNGVISTLAFVRSGYSPGSVRSLNVKLADINGTSIPVITRVDNPLDASKAAANAPAPAGDGTAGTPRTSAPLIVPAERPGEAGAGGAAPDEPAAKEQETQPLAPEPGRESEPGSIAALNPEGPSGGRDAVSFEKSLERKMYVQKSILDCFRDYQGERTTKALISLFEQENFTGFRQKPSVALSDGSSPVQVTFTSPPGNKTSSDVAVIGAQILSIKNDPDNTNTWTVELKPKKDAYQASLAVLQGNIVMVYPLTIAPRLGLDDSARVTKADLDLYLRDRRTTASRGMDLNNDNRRDYIDDYIITANYLATAGQRQIGK